MTNRRPLIVRPTGRPPGSPDRHGRAARVDSSSVRAFARRFAQRVHDLRLERDLSVLELATAAGVSPHTIRGIERADYRSPGILTVYKIARAMMLSPTEILP